jgi:hypothetical protein
MRRGAASGGSPTQLASFPKFSRGGEGRGKAPLPDEPTEIHARLQPAGLSADRSDPALDRPALIIIGSRVWCAITVSPGNPRDHSQNETCRECKPRIGGYGKASSLHYSCDAAYSSCDASRCRIYQTAETMVHVDSKPPPKKSDGNRGHTWTRRTAKSFRGCACIRWCFRRRLWSWGDRPCFHGGSEVARAI